MAIRTAWKATRHFVSQQHPQDQTAKHHDEQMNSRSQDVQLKIQALLASAIPELLDSHQSAPKFPCAAYRSARCRTGLPEVRRPPVSSERTASPQGMPQADY
ncbi:hypothetical protein [Xanthomonas citri]|uniref:hypothetical protein n=1 Tax=Xanthomonas citri TaxID=346 RepID=UPI00131BFEAC|nr:hypothetical protein [Xanthomonas citri]